MCRRDIKSLTATPAPAVTVVSEIRRCLLEREQSQFPRDPVVIAGILGWVEPLIQVLKLSHVNLHRFIVAGTNHLTVADVVGPRSAIEGDILLAGKRRGSTVPKWRPGAFEAISGPRSEIPMPVRGLVEGFDERQVSGRALDLVDVTGFK